MNILIANDDGPVAYGLTVLQRAARVAFPDARIVTIAPHIGQGGLSLAITPAPPEDLMIEQLKKDFYVCHGKPADLIYLGLGLAHRFLPDGRFDLVLTGVNHGQNVGMDVFHSGTVGMAMLASALFGVPAMAFSQQVEYGSSELCEEVMFRTAVEYLPHFLRDVPQDTPCVRSVNFPLGRPKGQRVCKVSMYSRFRPHLAVTNRREQEDVAQLENGYITISFLQPTALSGMDMPSQQTSRA